MVKYVCLICHKRLVPEGLLECLYALLIFLELVISKSLFVEHLGVFRVEFQRCVQIGNSELILAHIEVALRSIFQEVYIDGVFTGVDRHVVELYSLRIILDGMKALAKPVENGRVF